jgi:hypothetical protein
MSHIHITTYDGDAEKFNSEQPDTAGSPVGEESFTYGEELLAAERIMELLREHTHFDVRHTVF